jgi:glyoxylase-like metal-dependent hydrolase (beta-lactamase superfamily II)
MTETKLYAFNCADSTLDHSYAVQMLTAEMGEEVEDATRKIPFYLIDHPEGSVLFDTGVSYDLIDDPKNYGPYGEPGLAELVEGFPMSEKQQPAEQLADAGYPPAEIDYVVMSHLHVDHAGNVDQFPDAEFLIQQDELAYAWWPSAPVQKAYYLDGDIAPLRDPAFDVTELSGEYDLFGDGSVVCIPTPGHSPGHQSLLVRSSNAGSVILGGDIAGTHLAYEQEIFHPYTWNTEEAAASARSIRQRAVAEDAEVVILHDADDFASLPSLPEAYQ